MLDWNGRRIPYAETRGGVIAVTNPIHNLVGMEQERSIPSELIPKIHKSPHIRYFSGDERRRCKSSWGFYCDLQSMHSEDAITWSVFGTMARSTRTRKEAWLREFFEILNLSIAKVERSEIRLWHRLRHPDSIFLGGPEVDVLISTEDTLMLIEAKWLSPVDQNQGESGTKDQIQLRGEFLAKFGPRLFPPYFHYVVVGISLLEGTFVDTTPKTVLFRSITWEVVCALRAHPLATELGKYYEWRKAHTHSKRLKI